MKIGKILAWILMLSLSASLFAACTDNSAPQAQPTTTPSNEASPEPASGGEAVKVGLIATGFGAQSFNDDVLDGLKMAAADMNIEAIPLEVPEVSDVPNSLRTLAGQGASLIIVAAADHKDGMLEIAAENPQTHFLYLAEALEDAAENIMSVSYRENEGSFLAGALAGLMTESDVVGAVIAGAEALQLRYLYGYMAGVQAVNPQAEVLNAQTNSYADVAKGNEVANVMFNRGADYIGTYAGACNLGVFQAAQDAGEGKYCFGAANGQFDSMPDKIVASVVKPVDLCIYGILEDYLQGEFDTSAPKALGIKEDGVTLLFTPEPLVEVVPDDVMAKIEDLREQIANGDISIPGTEAEFNAFDYSYQG